MMIRVLEPLRKWVVRYIQENFNDLLALDMKWARILGAPAPHTISSYSHIKWTWLEPIINKIWFWLYKTPDHCLQDYKRVTNS